MQHCIVISSMFICTLLSMCPQTVPIRMYAAYETEKRMDGPYEYTLYFFPFVYAILLNFIADFASLFGQLCNKPSRR